MKSDSARGNFLSRLFWIVACFDVFVVLAVLLTTVTGSPNQYDYIVEIGMLVIMVLLGAIIGVVALIRNGAAYGIGLALVVAPPLYYGTRFATEFVTTPSAEAQQAGHGYFTQGANRALADAIVAGDGPKVASLLPTANPNALGWNGMTFMRLALGDGHANPDIVASLLRAGANPDQDNQLLFGSMGSSDDYGDIITTHNERVLRAVLDAGVDLNHGDQVGEPRFFAALKWPEGLAVMLEHGANTEAEDNKGNTAIMWAVGLRCWPSIDVLLAHGARVDHVNHDGKSVRDWVLEARGREHGEIPPQLAALEARLR